MISAIHNGAYQVWKNEWTAEHVRRNVNKIVFVTEKLASVTPPSLRSAVPGDGSCRLEVLL